MKNPGLTRPTILCSRSFLQSTCHLFPVMADTAAVPWRAFMSKRLPTFPPLEVSCKGAPNPRTWCGTVDCTAPASSTVACLFPRDDHDGNLIPASSGGGGFASLSTAWGFLPGSSQKGICVAHYGLPSTGFPQVFAKMKAIIRTLGFQDACTPVQVN